jgi:hypothetical protein
MPNRHLAVVTALVLAPWAGASAQQFPVDEAYQPWPCDTGVMTDPFQDESGAIFERDLIGDVAAPTGLRAADAEFLYVRLRVDRDPAPGGSPSPFAWGLLVDSDANASTYEVMLVADGGGSGTVAMYRNTSSTPGDARDPPDPSPVAVYSWTTRARSTTAPGSAYGSTPDYFVDFALSWSDLAAVGIGATTPVRVWAATASSSATNGMTGDFACRNGGAPTLGSPWPGTAPDPGQDSDGDGFSDATEIQNGTDPNDSGSHPAGGGDVPRLAGGGGCQHGTAGIAALAAVVALVVPRTRRRLSLATKR